MAVPTSMSKARMAELGGFNYDVMTDEYIMSDGTRISAKSVAQGSISYGQLTGPLPSLQQQQQDLYQQQQHY